MSQICHEGRRLKQRGPEGPCPDISKNPMRSVPCGDVISGTSSVSSIQQAGAVCFRLNSVSLVPEVLLVTSRRTGLWGIPKGTIEDGESAASAALREAHEEAGVTGQISNACIGRYFYSKGEPEKLYEVHVHGLKVEEQGEPDEMERNRLMRWAPAAETLALVSNVELQFVLRAALPMIEGLFPVALPQVI